mmetsp:Transcript_5849/g.17995  ORF Transcript_5849/g.17995 Transcript_5849/m.17995 type:complete len:248 (+) Transcript_5849:524-1267(+)
MLGDGRVVGDIGGTRTVGGAPARVVSSKFLRAWSQKEHQQHTPFIRLQAGRSARQPIRSAWLGGCSTRPETRSTGLKVRACGFRRRTAHAAATRASAKRVAVLDYCCDWWGTSAARMVDGVMTAHTVSDSFRHISCDTSELASRTIAEATVSVTLHECTRGGPSIKRIASCSGMPSSMAEGEASCRTSRQAMASCMLPASSTMGSASIRSAESSASASMREVLRWTVLSGRQSGRSAWPTGCSSKPA